MRPRDALAWIYVMTLVATSAAYKILVAFPFPAKSHSILSHGVVRHLLNAGHEVTYITPFIRNNSNPNLHQIDVSGNSKAHDAIYSYFNVKSLMANEKYYSIDKIFNIMINITRRSLKNENVLNLLNDPDERFDVVISQWIFNEVFSGFATVYDCPHIWYTIHEPSFAILSMIDEVLNPAYTASVELSYVPPLNFWQRLRSLHFQISENIWSGIKNELDVTFHTEKAEILVETVVQMDNVLSNTIKEDDILYCNAKMYRSVEMEVFDETFGPILSKRNRRLPSYETIRLNSSLMLGNYHVSIGQALRLPQNYIPVGGQHIEEDVKSLPEDIKKIMDEAKHGVIYFSMGSNFKSKELPDSMKQGILKLFAELKQTVIWKFEDTLPNLPENVHIVPWAPQQSILSHPHCVMFISHGGLLSTIEAVHFSVPFIGIPMFYDQQVNVERAVLKEIALKVELTERLAEHLKSAVHEMLSTSKYWQRMKEVSFIYHHRPMKPGKELVHWVEHVVKTGGATHLRSPALLMPWYQKIYFDFAIVVLLIIILIFFGIKQAARSCLSAKLHKRKMKCS